MKKHIEDVAFDPMNFIKEYLKDLNFCYNREIDDALSEFSLFRHALKSKFITTYNIDFFKIGLYHGTDAFVLDHSSEIIQRYRTALKKYRNVFLDHYNDYKDFINSYKKYCHLNPDLLKTESFKYDNIYVTTNPCVAYFTYAKGSDFMGELGFFYKLMREVVEKTRHELELDEETKNILYEMCKETEGRERKPILLKCCDLTMIEATDVGLAYNPYSLKECYLSYFGYDNLSSLHHLDVFRMKKELSINDFDVVEDIDNEVSIIEKNRARLKRAYIAYVETFIELNQSIFDNVDSFRSISNEIFGVPYDWLEDQNEEIDKEEKLKMYLNMSNHSQNIDSKSHSDKNNKQNVKSNNSEQNEISKEKIISEENEKYARFKWPEPVY